MDNVFHEWQTLANRFHKWPETLSYGTLYIIYFSILLFLTRLMLYFGSKFTVHFILIYFPNAVYYTLNTRTLWKQISIAYFRSVANVLILYCSVTRTLGTGTMTSSSPIVVACANWYLLSKIIYEYRSPTTRYSILASKNIGTAKGLSHVRRQAITCINGNLLPVVPTAISFNEILITTLQFQPGICIWNCHPRNVRYMYFVH